MAPLPVSIFIAGTDRWSQRGQRGRWLFSFLAPRVCRRSKSPSNEIPEPGTCSHRLPQALWPLPANHRERAVCGLVRFAAMTRCIRMGSEKGLGFIFSGQTQKIGSCSGSAATMSCRMPAATVRLSFLLGSIPGRSQLRLDIPPRGVPDVMLWNGSGSALATAGLPDWRAARSSLLAGRNRPLSGA